MSQKYYPLEERTTIFAESILSFVKKIPLTLTNETKYWLRLLARTNPELINDCRKYWQEAREFTLIFSKANSTMKKSMKIR